VGRGGVGVWENSESNNYTPEGDVVKKQVTPGCGMQQFRFLRPTPLTSHETQKPPRYVTFLYRNLDVTCLFLPAFNLDILISF
jgi:hypothetical protein